MATRNTKKRVITKDTKSNSIENTSETLNSKKCVYRIFNTSEATLSLDVGDSTKKTLKVLNPYKYFDTETLSEELIRLQSNKKISIQRL